jgi:ion channel-forming bestrophin family protein
MIAYNPKDWFTFIFRFHKADTFRRLLPMIIAISVYSTIIAWIEMDYLHMPDTSRIKNISIMHTMLTFVISMMLVFRTNSAYDRWWEGRKLWGSLVNNARNLSVKLNTWATLNEEQQERYANLIAAYPVVLQQHLGNTPMQSAAYVDAIFKNLPRTYRHRPTAVVQKLTDELHTLYKEGRFTESQWLLVNNEVNSLLDICGGCERIKSTPIPYSYSSFLKKFIFFFVMSLPVTLVFSLGYYCVPLVAFIFYVLTSIELVADEIEDPFGGDSNDLPIEQIALKIEASVFEIFDVKR